MVGHTTRTINTFAPVMQANDMFENHGYDVFYIATDHLHMVSGAPTPSLGREPRTVAESCCMA